MHGTSTAPVGASLGLIANNGRGYPDAAARQVERYELQSVARLALPMQRVGKCMHWLAPGATRVMVNYSEERQRAKYGNLMVCGSPWVCPVCALAITERRRQELRQAIVAFEARGVVVMATYTFQHGRLDSLNGNLVGMLGAFERMRRRKGYERLRHRFCIPYVVRAVEATWSRGDGWHPHMHQLLFLEGASGSAAPLSRLAAAVEEELFALWSRSCETKGLHMSRAHGLRVDTGAGKVEEYVAKFGVEPQPKRWTAAEEMTKGHMKHGHESGDGDRHLTPFDLLRWARDGGEEEPVKLFRQYGRAFRGKRQLSWTPNMREDLAIGPEVSDEELAAAQDPKYVTLAELQPFEWDVIRRKGLKAQVLNVAGQGDRRLFWEYIKGIMAGES